MMDKTALESSATALVWVDFTITLFIFSRSVKRLRSALDTAFYGCHGQPKVG